MRMATLVSHNQEIATLIHVASCQNWETAHGPCCSVQNIGNPSSLTAAGFERLHAAFVAILTLVLQHASKKQSPGIASFGHESQGIATFPNAASWILQEWLYSVTGKLTKEDVGPKVAIQLTLLIC